jgi:hypothetical protein
MLESDMEQAFLAGDNTGMVSVVGGGRGVWDVCA